MKIYRFLFTVIVPLTIFIVMTVIVLSANVYWFDQLVYSHISVLISKEMTRIMKLISYLASGSFLTGVCLLLVPLFLIQKGKYSFNVAMLIINISLSSILNVAFKSLIKRARPDLHQLVEITGLSYPSGHSMASMSFYGFLIYLCLSKINCKYKFILIPVLTLIILLIGFSRIYLGVHYASDVVGGFSLSLFWVGLFTFIIDKYRKNLPDDK